MTETLRGRAGGAAAGGRGYLVREERDRQVLERALSADRAYAAYALGHLEPELFAQTRYWIAEGPSGDAVVLQGGALGRTTIVVGESGAIDAALSLHPGSRTSYLSTAATEHRAALDRAYVLSETLSMRRMMTTRASFVPVASELRRLTARDAHRINALYATEGGPSRYSGETIDRAVYFGAFDGERLVAVAGTHVVAPNVGIAVVGNVFTDRAYRSLGLATRVTSAVTTELLELGCAEVVLTVDPTNAPAVRAYERLGYLAGSDVLEARVRRRDVLGIGPWLRRRAARNNGRMYGEGIELVHRRPALTKSGRMEEDER